MINLLCRFYDPISGSVNIDGYDIRQVKLSSLHEQMGLVLQEPFLFSGTVRDNIRYGRLDATDKEVQKVSEIVGAHEFIERIPEGYNTWVGERGVRISALPGGNFRR